MSELKHTPGPWNIYVNSQDDLVIRKMFPDGQESHSIARCHSGFANARLIAAAPETAAERDKMREINAELLEVATWLVRIADSQDHGDDAAEEFDALVIQARATIAKATGQ